MTAKANPNRTSLKAGEIVENFGAIVRVDFVSDRGAHVTVIPWTIDGMSQGGVGQRYIANPSKCVPVNL